MANQPYLEFHHQLQWAESNHIQQMTTGNINPPLTVNCVHCGSRVGITEAELHCWPGRTKGREHGWVVVCPQCGTRMMPTELNQVPGAVPPPPPQPEKKGHGCLIALGILAAAVVILFAILFVAPQLGGSKKNNSSNYPISGDIPNTGTDDTDETGGTEDPVTDTDGTETDEDETDPQNDTGETGQTDTDTAVAMESYYEVFVDDISWYDAMTECGQKTHNGVSGHLATITSAEEYEKVVQALEEYIEDTGNDSLNYIWLGAINDETSCKSMINNFTWITGETWSYDNWCNAVTDDGVVVDEPSFVDEGNDYAIEECLALWGFKHDQLGWTFSDQNGNLPEVYPSACGKIGYICEYDESEQVEEP